MKAKILKWARVAFFVGVLLLGIGILLSALVSRKSILDANEVMALLAILCVGLIAYRELKRALAADAARGGADDSKSNRTIAPEASAIDDYVRNTESDSLINRLKRRRALALVVLLCVLLFPVALLGIPAVLDGRTLSGREVLMMFFLQIAVVVGLVMAWRRARRQLE